jgi:hypothetical protein
MCDLAIWNRHRIGCNVRIHDKSIQRKTDKSTQSNSRKGKIATTTGPQSSTPPQIKPPSDKSDKVGSVYNRDCNNEFFYESTDEEWSSEDKLPMVGTSVLEAVKDLNNQSIGFKMR